ncbi:hypothetical protein EYF80_022963 [Liparis tanakae]|uniref:Uncharacterized protein n=1 Tax=Liparis tanakae TaxID=230148 RepID=A0A4Z2HPK8_9TELE|nr:hypothetical protein EYF80_022963 [Liparis tanakae]
MSLLGEALSETKVATMKRADESTSQSAPGGEMRRGKHLAPPHRQLEKEASSSSRGGGGEGIPHHGGAAEVNVVADGGEELQALPETVLQREDNNCVRGQERPLSATTNSTARTSSKHPIHFLRSVLWPPTSYILDTEGANEFDQSGRGVELKEEELPQPHNDPNTRDLTAMTSEVTLKALLTALINT